MFSFCYPDPMSPFINPSGQVCSDVQNQLQTNELGTFDWVTGGGLKKFNQRMKQC